MGGHSHYLSEHSEYLANIILVRQRTELYVHYINDRYSDLYGVRPILTTFISINFP